MIEQTILDPTKLNKGQLIQKRTFKSASKLDSTGVSAFQIIENKKKEKKEVSNVVFCDWFEVTILSEIATLAAYKIGVEVVRISEHLIFRSKNTRTKNYNFLFDVIYMGEEFATIQVDPSADFLEKNSCQLKINNEHLYRSDWLDTYKEVFNLLGAIHKSNTRIDLCIDGEGASRGKSLATKTIKGRVYARKGKAAFNVSYNGKNEVTRFHVGSQHSNKCATIYDKVEDIEKKGKDYIKRAWSINGLKDTGGVDRFELRMRSKVANKYSWELLDNPTYMASIIRSETNNWFQFYYNGRDKNKHRMHKHGIDWIDWDSIEGKLLPKSESVRTTGVHRAKRVIKDLNYLAYVCGFDIDQDLINELLDDYCLFGWYTRKLPYWHSEWERDRRIEFTSN